MTQNENPQGQATQGEATKKMSGTEEFEVSGEMLLAKVKEILHEGNVRRIVIKSETGNIVAEFPLTAGVIGALLLPALAAIGAIAALAANYTIVVERKE